MDTKKYYFNRKPKQCPKCGEKTIASIQYGMPAYSDELQQKIDSGKIVLGGCCITNFDPSWMCTSCKTELFKEFDINLNDLP